jgi:predicted Zn finger-like uncharacterized protein
VIVSCESCKSKYKLDDAKITGRGAKITCPRCKHVFVVYARTEPVPPATPAWEAPRPGGLADAVKSQDSKRLAPSPAPPAAEPGPAPGWDDEEPTRINDGKDSADHGHEVSQPAAKPPVAPAPAPPPPPASPPAHTAGEYAARAASLDFRKVGVTTWKVKVRIGLIYDFSDIRTLRKYIQDGRVTPADVVSWDGKNWKPIGEIPDLDMFFVETWEMLAARKEEAPAAPPPPVSSPMSEPSSATATAVTQRNGGEPDRFQDPFEDMKRKQRDRADARRTGATPAPAKKPDPPPPNRNALYGGGVLLLLLVLGGAVWWSQQGGPVAPVANTPAPSGTPGGAPAVNDVDKYKEDIKNAFAKNPAPPPGPADPGATTSGAGTPGGPGGDPTVTPPPDHVGLTPVKPVGLTDNGATARTPKNGLAPTTNVTHDSTAADHEAIGDEAASGGDWDGAVMAYKKAVALDGRNARLLAKLGNAQYKAGDTPGAQGTLTQAASAGSKDAQRYLGDIARESGDKPGAIEHYQQYLKGSPRDAAEVQKLIASMSGG